MKTSKPLFIAVCRSRGSCRLLAPVSRLNIPLFVSGHPEATTSPFFNLFLQHVPAVPAPRKKSYCHEALQNEPIYPSTTRYSFLSTSSFGRVTWGGFASSAKLLLNSPSQNTCAPDVFPTITQRGSSSFEHVDAPQKRKSAVQLTKPC